MKSSLTIRKADVVLPGKIQKTDVSVINGVINAIGSGIPNVGDVIDAEGLFLIPGYRPSGSFSRTWSRS